MVSRTSSKCSSLYDSLPVLDSWYPSQPLQEQNEDPILIRSNTTSSSIKSSLANSLDRPNAGGRRSVSFSVDPPSIHYIDEDEDYEQPELSPSRRSSFPPHHHHHHHLHHPHGGARIKTLAKRLFPKQFIVNKVHAIPSTSS